jgi:hypothetical protein
MDREPEDRKPVPPEADRVAARAIVLAAVCCRGLIEDDAGKDGAEDLRIRVVAWVDRLGLAQELEEDERILLEAPLGVLDDRRRIDAGWRSEGMVVLAWALGCAGLPRHDEQCKPSDVANGFGFLSDRSETPLAAPRLRDCAEIEHWADTYLTLHWRLRQFSLDRRGMDFADFVSRCTWGPLTVEDLELIEGDLAIRGERIDLASEDECRTALGIARERHQAFNWLLGDDPVYSRITTDT